MKRLSTEEYFGKDLLRVFQAIDEGMFGYKDELRGLIDSIRYHNDFYLLGHDFPMFVEAQEKAKNPFHFQC